MSILSVASQNVNKDLLVAQQRVQGDKTKVQVDEVQLKQDQAQLDRDMSRLSGARLQSAGAQQTLDGLAQQLGQDSLGQNASALPSTRTASAPAPSSQATGTIINTYA